MADEQSGIPNYLPQFVEALRKDGAPQDTLDRFTAYWNALPADPTRMPCPFCFAAGYNGQLVTLPERSGTQYARCKICKKEIVVAQAR